MERWRFSAIVALIGTLSLILGPTKADAKNWHFTQRALADHPALYWGFDDGGVMGDYSGNDRDGTITGGNDPEVFRPGVDALGGNSSVEFKGNGHTASSMVFPASNTFSQVAWIKTTSKVGGWIMGTANSDTGQHDRITWISDAGHVYAGIWDGNGHALKSPLTYNDGQWHMVTQTLGANGWNLYVDKDLVASDPLRTTAEAYPSNRLFQVGRFGLFDITTAPGHYVPADDPVTSVGFRGFVDEAMYFDNKALTASEVSDYVDYMWQDSTTADVVAVVEPLFSFAIAGRSTSCNGAAPTTGTSSGSAAVGFGNVGATAHSTAAQDLTVASNSGSGWTVQSRSNGPFQDSAGHTISPVGGTIGSPGGFPALGSPGVGFTTSDLSLGGGNPGRFFDGTAKWAAMTTINQLIADESGPDEKTICVAYRLGVAPDTPAGSYSTQVTYTATPNF